MEFPFEKICRTEIETAELAETFADKLKDGDIIVLNGNLGTGKTFFIKKALKHFRILNATSPSFAIVNEYYGSHKVFHFDFYRLKKQSELDDIGFQEYINDLESIIFIEWGEMFPEILPKNYIEIKIENMGGTIRKFEIKNHE